MPMPSTYFNDLIFLPIQTAGQILDTNGAGVGGTGPLSGWAAPRHTLGGNWTWFKLGQGRARQSLPMPPEFSSRASGKWSEDLSALGGPGWPCQPFPSRDLGLARLLSFRHSVNRGVVSERFKHSSPVPSCGLSGGRKQVDGERP